MKNELTNIEWADYTFNPWRGCTKVSKGCANCYAETLSKRNPALLGEWGPGKPRVLAKEAMWQSPLKWHKDAESALNKWQYDRDVCAANRIPYTQPKPERPRVFCASLGDWLDDEVPIEWLARLLRLITLTPHLDWLMLTKRLENFESRLMAAYSAPGMGSGKPEMDWVYHWAQGTHTPPNIWLGTSVEDQAAADTRIPQLLKIPAKVRFVSCEPLLGPVNLFSTKIQVETWKVGESFDGPEPLSGIDWVIAGGESGPNARPCHPEWLRFLRHQCVTTDTALLFKQWGEWIPTGQDTAIPLDAGRKLKGHRWPDKSLSLRVSKKVAGRILDHEIHHAFPQPQP